jgi:hypothetical protein
LNRPVQRKLFEKFHLQPGCGGVQAAAAANPSYGQGHSNNHEQQQQQQQQMAGATGQRKTHTQHISDGQRDQQQQQQQQQKQSRWQKVQGMLQQYGPGAFLSYITCSNLLSVAMLSSAWLLFTRTTGCTPLQVCNRQRCLWMNEQTSACSGRSMLHPLL